MVLRTAAANVVVVAYTAQGRASSPEKTSLDPRDKPKPIRRGESRRIMDLLFVRMPYFARVGIPARARASVSIGLDRHSRGNTGRGPLNA